MKDLSSSLQRPPQQRSSLSPAKEPKAAPAAVVSQAQFLRVADTMRCSPNPTATAAMFALLLLEEGTQRAERQARRDAQTAAFAARCADVQRRQEAHRAAESATLDAKLKRHDGAMEQHKAQRLEELLYTQQRDAAHASRVSQSRQDQIAVHYDRAVVSAAAHGEQSAAWQVAVAQRRAASATSAQRAHDAMRVEMLKRKPSKWCKYLQDFAKNPGYVAPIKHGSSVLNSLLLEATMKRPSSAASATATASGMAGRLAAGMSLPDLVALAEEQHEAEQRQLDKALRRKLERREAVKTITADALREQRVQRIVADRGGIGRKQAEVEAEVRAELAAIGGETRRDASRTVQLAVHRPSASETQQTLTSKAAARLLNATTAAEQTQDERDYHASRRDARHVAAEQRRDRHSAAKAEQALGTVDQWRSRVAGLREADASRADEVSRIIASDANPIARNVALHVSRKAMRQEADAKATETALQDAAQTFVLNLAKSRSE